MNYGENLLNINFEKLKTFLINELKLQINSRGFKNLVIALSGGLDSALALSIAVESIGNENVLAFYLPYKTSSEKNAEHATLIASMKNVKLNRIDITNIVNSYFKNEENPEKLRIGNFCARTRMAIIFDRAIKSNALVLGTSNKSEIIMGYATIFGDNAYSINPLGDIYKSQIFKLAEYFDIPDKIINKPPSADLWEGQTDEGEFGMTYKEIDEIAYMYFDLKMDVEQIKKEGINGEKINTLINSYNKTAYKRELPYIIKIDKLLKGE